MMKKSDLKKRWESPAFLKSKQIAIEKLLSKSELKSELDMRGIILGNEGPVRSFWYADLADCSLANIDFSYGIFEGNWQDAVIESCKFAEAKIEACRMFSAKVTDSCFMKTKFKDVSMDDGVFTRCDFGNAIFRGKLMMGYGGRRAKFIECNFEGTAFSNIEFRACQFVNCIFSDAKWDKCVFGGVKYFGNAPNVNQFSNCDVQRSLFNGEEFTV